MLYELEHLNKYLNKRKHEKTKGKQRKDLNKTASFMNHSSEASKTQTQKSTVEKFEKRQPSEEYRSDFANRHLSPNR